MRQRCESYDYYLCWPLIYWEITEVKWLVLRMRKPCSAPPHPHVVPYSMKEQTSRCSCGGRCAVHRTVRSTSSAKVDTDLSRSILDINKHWPGRRLSPTPRPDYSQLCSARNGSLSSHVTWSAAWGPGFWRREQLTPICENKELIPEWINLVPPGSNLELEESKQNPMPEAHRGGMSAQIGSRIPPFSSPSKG